MPPKLPACEEEREQETPNTYSEEPISVPGPKICFVDQRKTLKHAILSSQWLGNCSGDIRDKYSGRWPLLLTSSEPAVSSAILARCILACYQGEVKRHIDVSATKWRRALVAAVQIQMRDSTIFLFVAVAVSMKSCSSIQ